MTFEATEYWTDYWTKLAYIASLLHYGRVGM